MQLDLESGRRGLALLALLLSSCGDDVFIVQFITPDASPPAGPDAGIVSDAGALSDAQTPRDGASDRYTDRQALGYLTAVNEQALQFASATSARLRDPANTSIVQVINTEFAKAQRRQGYLSLTAEDSALTQMLRVQFSAELTLVQGASANDVDLRFSEAQVRLMRAIIHDLEVSLTTAAREPDLADEINATRQAMYELLQHALNARNRIRESGVYMPPTEAGVPPEGGIVDAGGDAGVDASFAQDAAYAEGGARD